MLFSEPHEALLKAVLLICWRAVARSMHPFDPALSPLSIVSNALARCRISLLSCFLNLARRLLSADSAQLSILFIDALSKVQLRILVESDGSENSVSASNSANGGAEILFSEPHEALLKAMLLICWRAVARSVHPFDPALSQLSIVSNGLAWRRISLLSCFLNPARRLLSADSAQLPISLLMLLSKVQLRILVESDGSENSVSASNSAKRGS